MSALLTEGLPPWYRTHFFGKRFLTVGEWLICAQDIEADQKRDFKQRPKGFSAHFADTKSKPKWNKNKPNSGKFNKTGKDRSARYANAKTSKLFIGTETVRIIKTPDIRIHRINQTQTTALPAPSADALN